MTSCQMLLDCTCHTILSYIVACGIQVALACGVFVCLMCDSFGISWAGCVPRPPGRWSGRRYGRLRSHHCDGNTVIRVHLQLALYGGVLGPYLSYRYSCSVTSSAGIVSTPWDAPLPSHSSVCRPCARVRRRQRRKLRTFGMWVDSHRIRHSTSLMQCPRSRTQGRSCS